MPYNEGLYDKCAGYLQPVSIISFLSSELANTDVKPVYLKLLTSVSPLSRVTY